MNRPTALESHEALIAGLLRPEAYPEPVDAIERIDTHISTVLLAGAHAYKVKKPVDLGFLDFSTAERRLESCREELRLNRRTAPRIYLDVVPITGTVASPRVGAGGGAPLEHSVRMRRFDNALILDRLALRGELTDAVITFVSVSPGFVDRQFQQLNGFGSTSGQR